MSIPKLLENFISRANDQTEEYLGEGLFMTFKCKLAEPAKAHDFELYYAKYGKKLPEELFEFLSLCNGMIIGEFADTVFLSIDDILFYTGCVAFPERFITIANCCSENILLDTEASKGEASIYLMGECADSYTPLNCNFEEFLMTSLVASGANFWVCDWFYKNANSVDIV